MAAEDGEPTNMAAEDGEPTNMAAEDGEPTNMAAKDGEPTNMAAKDGEPTNMAAEDGEPTNMAAEDVERGGLRRKLTGPTRLLLGRTKTRRTGEETKPEPAGNGEETQTDCRGRQRAAGKRRRRWWSSVSSAVDCIRRQGDEEGCPPEGAPQRQEDREGCPPEGAPQRQGDREGCPPEGAPQRQEDREGCPPEGAPQRQEDREGRPPEEAPQRQEEPRKMRNVLRRFVPVQKKSSSWFRTKLQKFFIRAGRRRSVPLGHDEDDVPGSEPWTSRLAENPEGPPQVQMFHHQAARFPEEAEPAAETDPDDGRVQTAHINQVLVRDVSSEEDEVLFDSELVVDLHDQPMFQFPQQDKPVQMSVPPTNGPSIRIQLCPPDDSAQQEEQEEEGGWVGGASPQTHLLHLTCSDPSEPQLLQAARSLVRTVMAAAVDQLTREQRGSGGSAHLEPPGAR